MRNKPVFFVVFLMFAIFVNVLAPVTVCATTLIGADLGELTHAAIAVVRGRVAAVQGRWTDDRSAIETIVTLDVDEYWKGDLGPTVQFRVAGGLLGRFRSVVVGAPRFAVDDRVVVFLGTKGPMIPFVVGFSQGVYRIAGDSVVRGEPGRAPLSLGEFQARVRTLAGSAK